MDEGMRRFKLRLEREVLTHPVIVANPYTAWFKHGELTRRAGARLLDPVLRLLEPVPALRSCRRF